MKIACIQITSGADMAANIEKISIFIAEAAVKGAAFIATPENIFLMDEQGAKRTLYTQNEHPGVIAASKMVKQYGVWLLVGSVAIKIDESGKTVNRSILFSPTGEIVATYDKIHLFDVEVGDGQTYRESAKILAGDKVVIANIKLSPLEGEGGERGRSQQSHALRDTPLPNTLPQGDRELKLGLSICYDVRFPYLYRALAKAGAQIISVPAAFTQVTGEAHWHVLLRARAIENGCFVIAPAQCGTHAGGRKTYGH